MTTPLALYIHIPWCQRKCPYCDFNSHAVRDALPVSDYLNALIQDLQQQLPLVQQRPLHSIFIGGGTPSLMPGEFYHKLFEKLADLLTFSDSIEITLEANPGTAEQERFHAYRAAGINRLSLGVQSFQDAKLMVLGRIHQADHARRAFAMAREAGFANVNIDLMFGLPQQSTGDALHDLQQAIALQPEHLSWYQLTLEPNTYFYRHPPALPMEDAIWDMQLAGQQLLLEHGYRQYEVSAYALSGKRCAHNLNYWQFGDYLGIGAGAHGKNTDSNGLMTRRWNVKHPQDYLNVAKPFVAEEKLIPANEVPFEFMLNALRLQQPVSVQLLTERTRLSLVDIAKPLQSAQQQGLLEVHDEIMQVTPLGQRFLNDLVELFLAS